MKNWFKNIAIKVAEKGIIGFIWAGLKMYGLPVVLGLYASVATYVNTREVNHIKSQLSNTPMKMWHYHTIITDKVSIQVQKALKECNARGIYSGLFTVVNGEGKFIFLQGVWDFGFSEQQKLIMKNPQQYIINQDIINIVQKASIGLPLLGSGSTKHTNDLYSQTFSRNSVPCRLDAETMQVFANNKWRYQVLDIENDEVTTTFSACVKKNINISKFAKDLEKIYVYPLYYSGLDIAFLTLSFQMPEDGQCFSNDRTKQGILFDKIRHIINENVAYV